MMPKNLKTSLDPIGIFSLALLIIGKAKAKMSGYFDDFL